MALPLTIEILVFLSLGLCDIIINFLIQLIIFISLWLVFTNILQISLWQEKKPYPLNFFIPSKCLVSCNTFINFLFPLGTFVELSLMYSFNKTTSVCLWHFFKITLSAIIFPVHTVLVTLTFLLFFDDTKHNFTCGVVCFFFLPSDGNTLLPNIYICFFSTSLRSLSNVTSIETHSLKTPCNVPVPSKLSIPLHTFTFFKVLI